MSVLGLLQMMYEEVDCEDDGYSDWNHDVEGTAPRPVLSNGAADDGSKGGGYAFHAAGHRLIDWAVLE